MSAAAARQLTLSRTTLDLIGAGSIPGSVSYARYQAGNAKGLTDVEKGGIMAEYAIAFERANPGKRAEVFDCGRGWYQIETNEGRGRQKHRIHKIAEMVLRLVERAHGEPS